MMNMVTDDQHHCSVSGVLFASSMEQILKQDVTVKIIIFWWCLCFNRSALFLRCT